MPFGSDQVNPSVGSGFDRDSVKPQFRARLNAIAKRREAGPTDETGAAFKESDRERKFSTESRVVRQ